MAKLDGWSCLYEGEAPETSLVKDESEDEEDEDDEEEDEEEGDEEDESDESEEEEEEASDEDEGSSMPRPSKGGGKAVAVS